MENKKEEGKECPACKSTDTKLVEKRKSNGVMGPGFYSWVVDSYYSCQNCGVRFDEIKKIK